MNRLFPWALLLALLSGAAGLAHQILWTRRLVDVLGASADTFSKVVGAFFVGLAFGAWLASGAASPTAQFWKRLAWAELAVATLALPVLFSVELSGWLHQSSASSMWAKVLLPLLLVTPPAMAMGLVIPWMVRALAANEWFEAKHPVWLYAVNTLGGVLGIAFIVLEALPRWGLKGAGVSVIGLNVLVACGAFALNRHGSSPCHEVYSGAQPRDSQSLLTSATTKKWGEHRLLAFASGFLVLALEVILQHQLAQVTINSFFSSAIVLTLVLASLTIAAALVPLFVRWTRDGRRALRLALFVTAMLCAVQPFLLTGLRGGLNILPYELPPLTYTWEVIKLGLLTICPMLLASGFVFPLLLRNAVANGGDDRGRRVGMLLAWNGVGGWLGAEFCQSWIAPSFGLWSSVVVVAAAYGILSIIEIARSARQTGSRSPSRASQSGFLSVAKAVVATIALAGLLLLSLRFTRDLPQAGVASSERLAAIAVGREGVLATIECGPGDWRMLFNNSYTLGGSKAQFNQERQGLLPLLLHGQPRAVATLGVATGGTVAGVALYPDVERIDAIELSPLVLTYADRFFSPFNRDVFRDPRLHFIQEDARWIIAGKQSAYDVVVGDLFLPWRTGEGRLFAHEHFENVRRSLKPGGLFCQWLPLFQLTRSQFECIVRTFREIFPDAFILRGDFYAELPIIGLVGGRELAKLDWAQIDAVCSRLRTGTKVTDPLVRHAVGVAMLVAGPLPNLRAGPVNTLANAWLEWDAGRNILGLGEPWFIGVPQAEFMRDIQRAGQLLFPLDLRPAQDAGQFFLTLEIAAKLNLSVLESMRAQIPERIPRSLREDSAADWRQWPSRVKPAFTNSASRIMRSHVD